MPGEPSLRERLAALETWRDEHRLQHDRQIQRQESAATRKVIVIAAIIGIAAAIIGASTGAIVAYLILD